MKPFNRLEYLVIMLVSAVFAAIAYTIYLDTYQPVTVTTLAMLVYLAAVVVQLYAVLGRLTDLNITKWAILLFIVPIANIILAFYLLFGRGYDDKHGVKRQTDTVTV